MKWKNIISKHMNFSSIEQMDTRIKKVKLNNIFTRYLPPQWREEGCFVTIVHHRCIARMELSLGYRLWSTRLPQHIHVSYSINAFSQIFYNCDRLMHIDTSYSYHPAIHDETFVRRKQRRNRTTFTLQQVLLQFILNQRINFK